jgi:hypothetical protein
MPVEGCASVLVSARPREVCRGLEKFVPVGAPGAVNPKFVEEPQIFRLRLAKNGQTPLKMTLQS